MSQSLTCALHYSPFGIETPSNKKERQMQKFYGTRGTYTPRSKQKNLATTFDPSNMYSPTRVKSAWIIYHFQDISWNIFVRLFQMMWKTCKRVWRILKGQLKVWLAATFINKSWLGICKFHGTPSMTQDEATSIISFFVLLWMKFNRRHYNNP